MDLSAQLLRPSVEGEGSDELKASTLSDNRAGETQVRQPAKPRLCAFLRMPGGCKWGNRCQFCHSLEELKLHPRYKTRPCLDYFQTGKCHQGVEECGFYHSEEERREPAPEGPAKEHRPIVPERCTFLESRGACYKGANCKFCHSEEQLRTIHKTRPCDNYWLHGFCSRGSNCGFYHDPAERRRSASSAIRSSSSSSHSPALLRKESAKYVHSSAGTPAQPHQFQRQDSAYESYRVSNASLDPFPSYLCRTSWSSTAPAGCGTEFNGLEGDGARLSSGTLPPWNNEGADESGFALDPIDFRKILFDE